MAFWLLRGQREQYVTIQDALYYQSLESAKASIGVFEVGVIIEAPVLENGVIYPYNAMHYYTRECGWFTDYEGDNPWDCGKDA